MARRPMSHGRMVRSGLAHAEKPFRFEPGAESNPRGPVSFPAWRQDDRVVNVNVGGNVVEAALGEIYF